MNNRKNRVKKLLATASILALSTTINSAVNAVEQIITGGAETLALQGTWKKGSPPVPLGRVPASGDWIKYGADGHSVNANVAPTDPTDTATWFNILEINLDGKTPAILGLNITENTTIGSIYGRGAALGLITTVNSGKALNLTGTSNGGANNGNYDSLTDLTLDNSTLIIDSTGNPEFVGTIELTGAAPVINVNQPARFDTTFTGASLAATVLNLNDNVSVTNPSLGEIGTINIGNDKTLSFGVDTDATLGNAAGGTGIHFGNANSILDLSNTDFGVPPDFDPVPHDFNLIRGTINNPNEGEVRIHGLINLQAPNPISLGTVASPLDIVQISGNPTNVNVASTIGISTRNLLLQGLNSTLIINNYSELNISNLLSVEGDLYLNNLDTDINFDKPLRLLSTGKVYFTKSAAATVDSTITLVNNLFPLSDSEAAIYIQNDSANNLTFGNNDKTIGAAAVRFSNLFIDGVGITTIDSPIAAKNLIIGNKGAFGGVTFSQPINLGAGSRLNIFNDGVVVLNEGIQAETININNKIAVIVVGDTKDINSNNITGGASSQITFEGSGTLSGTVTKLELLEVGAGDVTINNPGPHNIDEIRANGDQTLTLPDGFTLNGKIDSPVGGDALNLQFGTGVTIISGKLGETSRLGTLTIDKPGADVRFGDSGRVGDVIISRGKAKFTGAIDAINVQVNNAALLALNANIAATSLNVDGGSTLQIDNNLTIDAPLVVNGSTLALGQNILTLNQDTTFAGATTITVTPTAATIGHIVLGAVGGASPDLIFSPGSAINVQVNTAPTDTAAVLAKGSYVLLETPGAGGVDDNGIIPAVTDSNTSIVWVFDETTGEIKASARVVPPSPPPPVPPSPVTPGGAIAAAINAAIAAGQEDALSEAAKAALTQEILNGSSPEFIALLKTLPSDEIKEVFNDIRSQGESAASTEFGVTDVAYHNIMSTINSAVTNLVENRIDSTNVKNAPAGDERNEQYGAWFSPLYACGKQKMRNRIAGYNMKAGGATIGIDSIIKEDLLAGLAFTYVDNSIKYKAPRSGDRTKMKSYLLSLYGVKELERNFFTQGILTAGYNRVHLKDRRGTNSIGFANAKGRFSTQSYTAEVLVGHNSIIDNFTVTPMAGLRYSKFKNKRYRETGNILAKFEYAKKNVDKIEAIAGIKANMVSQQCGMTVTPELHGFIYHDFRGKKQHVKARMIGANADFPTRVSKAEKTSYNLGTGILAKQGMMEYGASYDLELARKYVGHQFGLKVKVLF